MNPPETLRHLRMCAAPGCLLMGNSDRCPQHTGDPMTPHLDALAIPEGWPQPAASFPSTEAAYRAWVADNDQYLRRIAKQHGISPALASIVRGHKPAVGGLLGPAHGPLTRSAKAKQPHGYRAAFGAGLVGKLTLDASNLPWVRLLAPWTEKGHAVAVAFTVRPPPATYLARVETP